jgi:hypothetical protein
MYGTKTCTLRKVDQRKVLKRDVGEGWRISVGLTWYGVKNEEVLRVHRTKKERNSRHTTKEGRFTLLIIIFVESAF